MTGGRLLIVGGDGALGAALAAELERRGIDFLATTRRKEAACPNRTFFDLLFTPFSELPLQGVNTAFLLAGDASVERCENDPEGTARLNVGAVLNLAGLLSRQGIRVIYPSTSRVFDGTRPLMPPHAPPCPITEYGRQRARTEAGLLAMKKAVILRMTKVLGATWPMIAVWQSALKQGRPAHPFLNSSVAPILTRHAVSALVSLAESPREGVFHLSACDDLAMPDVARRLALRLGAPASLIEPQQPSGASPGFSTPFSSLDMCETTKLTGIVAPTSLAVLDEWLNIHLPAAAESQRGQAAQGEKTDP
jgi:dTDP-4-dehydrorhamnose reductase